MEMVGIVISHRYVKASIWCPSVNRGNINETPQMGPSNILGRVYRWTGDRSENFLKLRYNLQPVIPKSGLNG